MQMHIADHPQSVEFDPSRVVEEARPHYEAIAKQRQEVRARIAAGHAALDAELHRRGHALSDADLRSLHDQLESAAGAAGAAGKDASGEHFTVPSNGGRPIKAWRVVLLGGLKRSLRARKLPPYIDHSGAPDTLCAAVFRIAARMAGSPFLGDLRYLDKQVQDLGYSSDQALELFS